MIRSFHHGERGFFVGFFWILHFLVSLEHDKLWGFFCLNKGKKQTLVPRPEISFLNNVWHDAVVDYTWNSSVLSGLTLMAALLQ